MKKKILSLTLVTIMSLSLLTGCGGTPESEIYVEPIEGLAEDFVRGLDISSLILYIHILPFFIF